MLEEALKNSQEELLMDLEQFVNIDSPSGFEEGIKRFQSLVIERLKRLGAEIIQENVDLPMAGWNVKAVWQGRGKSKILLLAHADTVWECGTANKRPFSVKGNRAYGPGVSDCKSGIAMILQVISALQKINFEDFSTITFVMNADEEKGSKKSREFIRSCAIGQDIAFCCEAGKAPDALTIWRKGSGQMVLEVHGKASHAGSAPDKGINAVVELCNQIIKMSALGDKERGTTINFTQIEGSRNPHNVIPDYAQAVASVRAVTNEEFDRVEICAKEIASKPTLDGSKIKVDLLRNRPPMEKTIRSDALVEIMKEIYFKELGLELTTVGSGGASDANIIADICEVIDSVGIVGGNAHHEEEYLELDTIVPRIYLLCRTIMSLNKWI